jgi:hypothetical protein
MKSLIVAAALLVLATPAITSPRHPTPTQWRDIDALNAAYGACTFRTDPEVVKKACARQDKLLPKLEAQGFCFVGKGGVGRAGGPIKEYPGSNHCYSLKRPR